MRPRGGLQGGWAVAALSLGLVACGAPPAPLVADAGAGGVDAGAHRDTRTAARRCAAHELRCGDRCADPLTDGDHCGGCGRSCGGGACRVGGCEPAVLARDQPMLNDLVRAGEYLYFANYIYGRNVGRVPTAGGRVEIVASSESGAFGSEVAVFGLATDGQAVYASILDAEWGGRDNGGVLRLPLAGGAAARIVKGVSRPLGLAAREGQLYWAGDGALTRAPVAGGAPQVLSDKVGYPVDVALTATHAYVTDESGGQVWRVPLAGGTPEVIVTGVAAPRGLALSTSTLYLGTAKGVVRCPLAGGAPEPFAEGRVSDLVIEGHELFYVEGIRGLVWRVPLAGGGAAEVLAQGQAIPSAITVDTRFVYWANQGDGRVMKLAR